MKLTVTNRLTMKQRALLCALLADCEDALSFFFPDGPSPLSEAENTADRFVLITERGTLLHATICRIEEDSECSIFSYTAPAYRRLGLASDAWDALCEQLGDDYPDSELHSMIIGSFSDETGGFLDAMGYEKETEYLLRADRILVPAHSAPAEEGTPLNLIPADDASLFDDLYEEIFGLMFPVFEEIEEDDASKPFLIASGGSPAGIAVLTPGPESVCLSHFGIIPTLRGRGLARAALAVIREAAGCPVTVQVSGSNLPAISLYRSSGFVTCEETVIYDLYI